METPARSRSLVIAVAAVAVAVILIVVVVIAGGDDGDDIAGIDTGTTSSSTPATPGDDVDDLDGSTSSSAPIPVGSAEPEIGLTFVTVMDAPASAVVDPAGDGPVLVSTLTGQVFTLDIDTEDTELVLDWSDRIGTGGERGLLGMTLDPDGQRLYLNYTNVDGDTEIRSVPMADGRPVDDDVLHLEIAQPYSNHNGGHLAFGPDGYLWIGTGDGGDAGDPDQLAQDPSSLLGKMLRVQPDPTGGVLAPADNPDWNGRPEIWAIGLRNPWRYSFDRETGTLWVADVGQGEVEEVNAVDLEDAPVNFGWDRMEGDQPFEGEDGDDLTAPVLTYGHAFGCSVTGGYVYRGQAIPALAGWYVYADYCDEWIHAVPVSDPGSDPVELAKDKGGVISFAELENGELLVMTVRAIYRIDPV